MDAITKPQTQLEIQEAIDRHVCQIERIKNDAELGLLKCMPGKGIR